MKLKNFQLLLFILTISGCMNIGFKQPEIEYYILNYNIINDSREKLPVNLNIDYFTISPIYSTNKFIFKKDNFRIEEDFYNRWITDPDKLLYDFVKKDFLKHNLLLIDNSESNYQNYKLKGHINEIYGHITEDNLYAILSINFSLYKYDKKNNDYNLIFNKIYTHKTKTSQIKINSFVHSMSKNMKIISEDLINDVYNNIKGH